MNIATQLEKAKLSITELNLLIKLLETNNKNISNTLKKVKAYQDMKKSFDIIIDAKSEENPKVDFTFSWNGEDVTINQIVEYQNSFKEIIEKLKIITNI